MLGADRTTEFNALPSENADADEGDDGVRFLTPLVAGEMATVELTVSELPAYVTGSIDFDQSRSWQSSEFLFRDLAFDNELTQQVEFMVPEEALDGRAFAEFYVHTNQSFIFPRHGEVEGYLVDIAASRDGPPTVSEVVINDLLHYIYDAPGAPTTWQTQGSDIRQIEVLFSEGVALSLADIQLVNLGVDAPNDPDTLVPLADRHLTLLGQRMILEFDPYELAAGVYELQLLDSIVDRTDEQLDGDGDGNAGGRYTLTGSAENRFYSLTADFNGDQGTSAFDLSAFAFWFGQAVVPIPDVLRQWHVRPDESAPEFMDLNGDGGVSIFDFNRFASAFDSGITFPIVAARGMLPEEVPTDIETDANPNSGGWRHLFEHETKAQLVDNRLAQMLLEWNQAKRPRRELEFSKS